MTLHPAAKSFGDLLDTIERSGRHGLCVDNFETVARLADGQRVTRAQFEQLKRYGLTTLNDGRVIDHTETLFCC